MVTGIFAIAIFSVFIILNPLVIFKYIPQYCIPCQKSRITNYYDYLVNIVAYKLTCCHPAGQAISNLYPYYSYKYFQNAVNFYDVFALEKCGKLRKAIEGQNSGKFSKLLIFQANQGKN